MEESELKEDLKNAQSLIICLSETVERLSKTIKQGKDEDLHKKMDKILQQMEKQNELKADIDYLKGELKKSQGYIAHFVECHDELKEKMNSAKLCKAHDTMETTERYAERFVKDLEKVSATMEEMNGKFEQISKSMEEAKGQNVDIEEFKMETEKSLANITSYFGITGRIIQECCFCGSELTNDLPLREDGVSVECPDCNRKNIVGKLKEGRIWMYVDGCDHYYYQQIPFGKEGEGKCQICGKKGEFCDGYLDISVRIDFDFEMIQIDNGIRCVQTSVERLSDPVLKCRRCRFILPKNLPIRRDGVSVVCTNCDNNNIVGKLWKNEKWIALHDSEDDDMHYQQVPCETEDGCLKKCIICLRVDELHDANADVALQ